jgi:hypothetical protein
MLENTGASNALSSKELAMVDSALYQENFYIARKYLREAREVMSTVIPNLFRKVVMDVVHIDHLIL